MDIKKIIREEIESSLDNWDWTEYIKPMEPAMMWLKDNFSNLKKLPPNEYDEVYYVDSKGDTLFYYDPDIENGDIYMNHYRIWMKLIRDFGLDMRQIQKLITDWLSQEPYNIKGFMPLSDFGSNIPNTEGV